MHSPFVFIYRTSRRNNLKSMAMAKPSYKLSRELLGHADQVRCLGIFQDGSIVSTSRDKTARFWKTGTNYTESVVMNGHDDFISAACAIEPTTKFPRGCIVTGGMDKQICIFYPGDEKPVHTFQAHDNAILNLKASLIQNESFLSCSSDHTGKLWNLSNLNSPRATFAGHSEFTDVWCIADLLNGSVVTGGSDKKVIVYGRSQIILHRLKGHSDCVRDIAVVNDNEFLTCANDAVVKHWNAVSGVCLGNYTGHTNHIYSITAINSGALAVSCGEDKTIKVWRYGQMDQTIGIPAQTVWSVKLLPNEDIACASSDGVVRIFTVDEKRFIDDESMLKFEQAVLDNLKSDSTIKKNKITKFPKASELNQPGEKDGDTIVIKEDNEVKAYRWSERQYQWKLIGDVVENEEKTVGKPVYNGVEYDYVFSVDIKENAPHLKLPYNKNQDPYIVAMQFIEDNDLDPKYLDRVANFIITNLQVTPILNAEAQFSNQFSGGSRYISNNPDICSNLSSSMSPPPNSLASVAYIPQTKYLKMINGNISAIHEKLKEINEKNENGIQSLPAEKLEDLIKLASNEDSASVSDEQIADLNILLHWPDSFVFPVLDITRFAVLREEINKKFCSKEIFSVLKRHLQKDAVVSNQMLTFRLLANLFSHEAGERFCLQFKYDVLNTIKELAVFENKNNEVAVSTFILNLVVALNKTEDTLGKEQTQRVIFKLLESLKETEAIFRVLIGLGTLILGASSSNERRKLVKSVKQSRPVLKALKILLNGVDSSHVPSKLLSVTRQILDLIRS